MYYGRVSFFLANAGWKLSGKQFVWNFRGDKSQMTSLKYFSYAMRLNKEQMVTSQKKKDPVPYVLYLL